ncbi:hypothetical protein [Caudoviricetes sp.]|nr:hypothetical protein [Caudoviricetes sp.]
MGTNFYAYYDGDHGLQETMHIGKSSGGWNFALRVMPELHINSLDDWINFIQQKNASIKNEYYETITLDQLLDIITNRHWDGGLRNYQDASDYVGNIGTCDYLARDFS